jgi:hypothetical protein
VGRQGDVLDAVIFNEAAGALEILFVIFSFSSTKGEATAVLVILFRLFFNFTFGESATALLMLL